MDGKRIRTAVKAAMLMALVGAFADTASAQDFRGTFRLSEEVRWGSNLLPAGRYTITMGDFTRPAVIRSASGDIAVFAMARFVDRSVKGLPAGLLIARHESERFVRALNWPRRDRALVYEPLRGADLAQLARADDAEAVPVRLAVR
jgi:hypothetical protein